ncbi:MAG: hypothetical protein II636_04890, partial [Bacteroidales bacterium]|nr:hypothetical protein [Bacteroidales bacterium]
QVIDIKDVMAVFRHPDAKLNMQSGAKVDYIMSRKIAVQVNKENVLKYGILSDMFEEVIPEYIVLEIPEGKDYLTKPELFLLDLLSNYEWDRPINMLNMGGDLNIGVKDYLMYDGYSYRLTPVKTGASSTNVGIVDPDYLYHLLMDTFKFDAVSRGDYFIDYQNLYTHLGVMSLPNLFETCAEFYMKIGQNERARTLLDKGRDVMRYYPIEGLPIGLSGVDLSVIGTIEDYLKLGCEQEGLALARNYMNELLDACAFYMEFYKYAEGDFDQCTSFLYYFSNRLRNNGQEELAKEAEDSLEAMIKAMGGAIEEKD